MRDLKFRTKDPQTVDTAVQNVAARTKRLRGFVQYWLQPIFLNFFFFARHDPLVNTQIETLYE